MTDLFDHAAAQDAKQSAMARGDANAQPDWKSAMFEAVKAVCREQLRFTADDVFEKAGDAASGTHNTKAFGSVMLRAAREGLCEKTDRVQASRRVSNHGRPCLVWASKVYRGG